MIVVILQVAGAVALLLWAVRLIRTGVQRAFMTPLRTALRRASGNRLSAAAAGAGTAVVMQSSTAVAMLAAAFSATGSLGAAAGLAILLGADLGSAIATQLLLLPVQALVPLLLLAGVVAFNRGSSRKARQAGRIMVGLALVFISLGMIGSATAPFRDSEALVLVMGYLSQDLVSAFAIGAALAWGMHSSIAAVLTVVTLAGAGVLGAPAAAALVLGANLGGAVIPVTLTLAEPLAARRIMLGNLILRGGSALLALMLIWRIGPLLPALGADAARQAINLHLAFNAAVLLAGLALLGPVTALAARLLAERPGGDAGTRLSALDEGALEDPERALACAAREVLRMGESVTAMLAPSLSLYRQWDAEAAGRIGALEDLVDTAHLEIKLYIARLQEGRLSADQSRRAMDLAAISNNLEDAGDQIATNLVTMARKMHQEGLVFSDDGWRELTDFHDRVLSNTQLALNILMTNDAEAARQLVEEKDRTRDAEQKLHVRHLSRLRQGNSASLETSNLHQETVRALKQINTAFTLIAYPIAREAGDLLSSRLAQGGAEG